MGTRGAPFTTRKKPALYSVPPLVLTKLYRPIQMTSKQGRDVTEYNKVEKLGDQEGKRRFWRKTDTQLC